MSVNNKGKNNVCIKLLQMLLYRIINIMANKGMLKGRKLLLMANLVIVNKVNIK